MRRVLAVLLGTIVAFAIAPLPAQQLGELAFPTSGSAAAQPHFKLGMLYLHSFEYESAARAFKEAQRVDPGFAMAYWGEAMTYNHPVWNQQNVAAARAALERLAKTPGERQARAPTEREKGYLGAVEVLYGEGAKAWRDTAYAKSMADLAARFPEDHEAQLFHALALLGLSQGARDVPTYMKAGAIALPVFSRHPDHPGAAHYVIHSFDDPTHAPLGLAAARAYRKSSPDAGHSQHMTSHIFLALGMWEDVVSVNETAVAVVKHAAAEHGATPSGCGHYPEWLQYGYLQQGRLSDAARVLEGCWNRPGTEGDGDDVEGMAGMRAAYIVDSRQWTGKYVEEPEARLPRTIIHLAFGTGYAAVRRGDLGTAKEALGRMEPLVARIPEQARPYSRILVLEIKGMIQAAEGNGDAAIASVREAAKIDDGLPIPFGPPWTIKPPHELLGEILAAQGKHADAYQEFVAALARTPRRPLAVLGLARSAEALGRTADAASAYALLQELWSKADPEAKEGIR
jgi:tetratricopeptide (TPR) repeat protein